MSKAKQGSRRGRARAIVVKTAIAFLSVCLTLVAADVTLRILSLGAPRRGILLPTPGRYRLTSWIDVFPPGYSGTLTSRDFKVHVRMNSLGLRERELDFDALSTQHPVLFMGDSYFFGWGVEQEERVSERFAALARPADPSVPVVNFSFPGWGISHYVEVWEGFVPRLRPRLVIVSCFVGNDFTDDLNQASRRRKEGEGRGGAATDGVGLLYQAGVVVRETLSTSPLIGLVNNLLWKSPRYRSFFSRMEIRNDRIALYETKTSALQRQAYASTKASLTALARLSHESGIPILIVLIPDHLQILMPALFQGLDRDRPQRELKEHLERQGLACIDLLPTFLAANTPERCFFREDKHWNARGHEFVAGELLPAVRELARRRLGATPDKPPRASGDGGAPGGAVVTGNPSR